MAQVDHVCDLRRDCPHEFCPVVSTPVQVSSLASSYCCWEEFVSETKSSSIHGSDDDAEEVLVWINSLSLYLVNVFLLRAFMLFPSSINYNNFTLL